MSARCYVLASSTLVPLARFSERRRRLPGTWSVVTTPEDLQAVVERLAPRYVFFPHWSNLVPDAVLSTSECVCFHMTDVPFGRGGSPLQNLIARGHRETRLTTLRMVRELDAGPVYRKQPLSLEGTAAEILARAATLILDTVEWMTTEEPEASPQIGEPTFFRRRRPEESRIEEGLGPEALFDHVRMLDAEGYPHAFLEAAGWRVEFTGAEWAGEDVRARAVFRRPGSNGDATL